jgi:hypothetical protein
MNINPMALLKYRERLELFRSDHPRMEPFFHILREQTLIEGTVYEMKATTPDGKSYVANIRLTANDIETIRMLHAEQDS